MKVETREEKERELIACHQALMKAVKSSAVKLWGDIDLSIAQIRTLYILAAGGPMVIGQLAQRMGIGVSTGGHLVDRLVQAGLVERTEDHDDRRRTLAHLSPKGEEFCVRLFDGMGQQMPLIIHEMSDEDLAALLQGLKGLLSVLEKRKQARSL